MRVNGRDVAVGLGRRDRRKQKTRKQLLLAGRRLFSRVGLYEARIEDLADEAGIAKGTLYLYFQDRDELAREVVAVGYEELQRQVTRRIRRKRALAARAEAIVYAHLDFFEENPDLQRIFHQARGMLKFARPEWSRLREPLLGHIAFLSRALADAPSVLRRRPAARWNLAVQLFGSVSGVSSVRTAVGMDRKPNASERVWVRSLIRAAGGPSRTA